MGRRRNQAYAGRNSILQSSRLEEFQPCRLKGAVSPSTRSIPAGYYFLSSEGSRNPFCIIDDSGSAAARFSAPAAAAGPAPLLHTAKEKLLKQNPGAVAQRQSSPHQSTSHGNSCLKGSRRTGTALKEGKGKGFGAVGHSIHIPTDPSCQEVKWITYPQTMTLKQTELSEIF